MCGRRVIGAARVAAACVRYEEVGGESASTSERASRERGGGGRERDHVLPQRPRGAEDTFIIQLCLGTRPNHVVDTSFDAPEERVRTAPRRAAPLRAHASRRGRAVSCRAVPFALLHQGRAKSRDYNLVATAMVPT
jgi:hypothetical protein